MAPVNKGTGALLISLLVACGGAQQLTAPPTVAPPAGQTTPAVEEQAEPAAPRKVKLKAVRNFHKKFWGADKKEATP